MRIPCTFKLHPEYVKRIKREAKKRGVSQAHIIEQAIYQAHSAIKTLPGFCEKRGRRALKARKKKA